MMGREERLLPLFLRLDSSSYTLLLTSLMLERRVIIFGEGEKDVTTRSEEQRMRERRIVLVVGDSENEEWKDELKYHDYIFASLLVVVVRSSLSLNSSLRSSWRLITSP